LYATPYVANGPEVEVITPILISVAACAGAMLGASTASESTATPKRVSERLLIKFSPHRIVQPAIGGPC
jgi:hypothetical protein